ncbi:MAG TPA: hypothetical protein VGB59_04675 [Allosphingosinicella sp.]|jgi:hypothetical protein
MIDRRNVLTGAALLGGASLFPRSARAAQATASAAPQPGSREEKVARRAAESRQRLDFVGGRFSGPAWDWLVEKGGAADFFLLGEEHGIAENSRLAAQLFPALVRRGYSKAAVEISPPMAREIDSVLARGGLEALRALFRDRSSNVSFFGMREEAEWLAAAREALPEGRPFLWGLDYEVGADRHLMRLLRARPKPMAAQAALARLEDASASAWGKYDQTGDPSFIYTFSGDPALVRAVRAAWPKPDPRSAWILDTLERTLEINRLWVDKRSWESNALRSANLRSNFLRYWRAEKGSKPRVFLKFGASHMMRGRNSTEVFDLGALVPELAEMEGKKAFSLLVLPGAGTEVAAFDVRKWRYSPQPADRSAYMKGLKSIVSQAYPDAFTLFDSTALRPLLGYSPVPSDTELTRMVHGFDAILVMSGSTASTNL